MRCASYRGPHSLASILLLISTVLSFAQGDQATAQVPIQRVVASPYPAPSHLETGYAVLEYTPGQLLIGGTAIAASDDAPLASAGFLARIDSDNNVLEWSEYGGAESIFPAAINVLVDLPDSGLIAGGVSADTGYLLSLDAEGETLWSAALDSVGIESVVAIEHLSSGGFLVFGESTFDSAIEGSGAYVAVPVDDEGTVGTPTRYGAAQQERIVQVVQVRGAPSRPTVTPPANRVQRPNSGFGVSTPPAPSSGKRASAWSPITPSRACT